MRMLKPFSPAGTAMSVATDLSRTDIGSPGKIDVNTRTIRRKSSAFGGSL